MRFVDCTNWSIHDLAMADSPAFFIVVEQGSNGEMYNLVLHGHSEGGLDGIDISGTNHWVHDIEVSNKDECVTVKSPASNFLIERIYCNWSGGSAIGSLSTGTAISNIVYNNVYSWQCNQMMMIKSNGGTGSVKSVTFENFIGHSNAYSLDIDQYWSGQSAGDLSTGVALSGITFSNWHGTCANGAQRAPIQILCSDAAPCTGITLTNFALWTDTGSTELYKCRSAYGSGGCLKSGSGGSYGQITQTISSAPAGYSAAKMDRDLAQGFSLTASIPIPTLGASYYPGLGLISTLMNGKGGVSGSGTPTTTTKATTTGTSKTTTTSTKTTAGGTSGCASIYAQCGGIGYTGPTCCVSSTCTYGNDYYSQCL
ncbi:Polygalacturonase [Arthrobotrys entomopaga]|nr:Polygalacturonase [Arthrobotrys entomopaga]